MLQEAASLTLKELNGYSFWINLSICHALNWTVALAGLGTVWLMCRPTKKDHRVTADTMLKMSRRCEQGKPHAGLRYEEHCQQIEGD